jgi:histidinol dehydrogenase
MIRILELTQLSPEQRAFYLQRAQADVNEAFTTASRIIDQVRHDGDAGLVALTREFDDPEYQQDRMVVTAQEIDLAYRMVPEDVIKHIKNQVRLSRMFHEEQRRHIPSWEIEFAPGIIGGEKWTAIDAVGLYVPGGKNPFPTVQQILGVAASVAGCRRIVSCISPRGANYEVLIAAREAGVHEIYRVGGAQAIAALAYGTESIAPVHLIAGPGSPYVTAAKVLCQKKVAIDMPAGPSEAIILADDTLENDLTLEKKAQLCAADILARAEHGPDSAGVMVTSSMKLAQLTRDEVQLQAETLSRKEYISAALSRYSVILVTDTLDEAISFVNSYAPEHLEVLCENPRNVLAKIQHAGSVFLGNFNPVAAGDYASGVNHILPTGTWANRTSAVGVWTFMKRVQFSELTRGGLEDLKETVSVIADIEGLDAHKMSVLRRFQ